MRAEDCYPDGPIGQKLLPLVNTQYHWPFIGVLPLIAACMGIAVAIGGVPVMHALGLAGLGWLVWTLGEYLTHRFAFHYEPRTEWGKVFLHYAHAGHHDDPKVVRLILVPVIISVPVLTGWAVIGYMLVGYAALPFVAGHAAGYLYYEHVHYCCHHGRRKIGWTKKQRKLHMYHHFKDHDRWFGVSTHLWDYVFRTHLPRAERDERTRPAA